MGDTPLPRPELSVAETRVAWIEPRDEPIREVEPLAAFPGRTPIPWLQGRSSLLRSLSAPRAPCHPGPSTLQSG